MAKENQDPKQFEEKKPIIETRINKSKDGKWLIHRTVIVDIKPIAYLKEIIKD